MTHAREHEFEPEHGLPERLPGSERVLWQGSPDWRALALRVFHVRKVALYFTALVALRALLMHDEGASPAAVALSAAWLIALGVLASGLLATLAWLSARSTVYTLTDRRIVMRIGIVLTLTFNIPFSRVVAADFRPHRGDRGDIALRLAPSDRIAWLHLWPHARPWRVGRPEPMLRAIPQAERVASLLVEAWSRSSGREAAAVGGPSGAAVPGFGAVMPSPAAAR
jgi:hypothetical protein